MSYLAMEFIDGVGRDRVIATAGRRPRARGSLAAQVADALDFAQEQRRHHDIKPPTSPSRRATRGSPTSALPGHGLGRPPLTGSLLARPSKRAGAGREPWTDADLRRMGAVPGMLAGKTFRGDSITPHLQDHHRGAAPDPRARPVAARRDRAHPRQVPGQDAGDALPDGPRPDGRPPRPDAAGLDADAAAGGDRHGAGNEGRGRAADHQRDPDFARGHRDRQQCGAGHRGVALGRSRAAAALATSSATGGRGSAQARGRAGAPTRACSSVSRRERWFFCSGSAPRLVLLPRAQPAATGSRQLGTTGGPPRATAFRRHRPSKANPATPPGAARATRPRAQSGVRRGPASAVAAPRWRRKARPGRSPAPRVMALPLPRRGRPKAAAEAGDRASDACKGSSKAGAGPRFRLDRRFVARAQLRDLGRQRPAGDAAPRHGPEVCKKEQVATAPGRMARASGFGLDVQCADTFSGRAIASRAGARRRFKVTAVRSLVPFLRGRRLRLYPAGGQSRTVPAGGHESATA